MRKTTRRNGEKRVPHTLSNKTRGQRYSTAIAHLASPRSLTNRAEYTATHAPRDRTQMIHSSPYRLARGNGSSFVIIKRLRADWMILPAAQDGGWKGVLVRESLARFSPKLLPTRIRMLSFVYFDARHLALCSILVYTFEENFIPYFSTS